MILFCLTLAALALALRTWRTRAALSRPALVGRLALAVGLVGAGLASLPNIYVLGKLAGQLAMPAGALWLAGLMLIVRAGYRGERRRAAWLGLGWMVYTLAGNVFVGGLLMAWLERDFRIDSLRQPAFDAVLVLGGGAAGDRHHAQLTDAGDRVVLGARMWHQGLSGVLVTSGSSIPGIGAQMDVSEVTEALWTSLGVPSEAIVRLPGPRNTREEIAAFAALQRTRSWQRVGLLTSAWHLRRAMLLAEKAGLQVHPLPADFRARTHWDGILSLIPQGYGFLQVHRGCWELLGAATGR